MALDDGRLGAARECREDVYAFKTVVYICFFLVLRSHLGTHRRQRKHTHRKDDIDKRQVGKVKDYGSVERVEPALGSSATRRHLLVDPSFGGVWPVGDLFGTEPQVDLALGGLVGVTAVDDVAASDDGVVTTDGAGLGLGWISGTKHFATNGDHVQTFPDLNERR